MISIVVPVFNRLENVKRMLHSFALQKDAPEFEIIVVDDGSTDGLCEWLEATYQIADVDGLWLRLFCDLTSKIRLKYFSGGPNKGFRAGRLRNFGAFNANQKSNWFLFTDSDIILNQYALKYYGIATSAHQEDNVIVVGPYHWLPPLELDNSEIKKIVTYEYDNIDELPDRLDIKKDKSKTANGIVGFDPRYKDFSDDVTAVRSDGALGSFSGNIAYPKKLYTEIGGFDEILIGHGGEDADCSLTASEHGAKYLFYKPLYGWHMWHPRDQARNEREVKANILFIDSKHAVGTYANAKKWIDSRDYSDPAQYHKHRGGIALKIKDDPTIFAARTDFMTRIGIPSLEWFSKLGFDTDDVKNITSDELVMYKLSGVARD